MTDSRIRVIHNSCDLEHLANILKIGLAMAAENWDEPL